MTSIEPPATSGPLLLCTIVYFLLSSWIITFAIALEKRLPPIAIWRENFAWISLNYFGGASVAAIIVSFTRELGPTFILISRYSPALTWHSLCHLLTARRSCAGRE